ncbi:hypothetical protein ACF3NS_07560 [Arsenicicoccus cauae]|uniref:Uncharacterized protein n=1 Tax=Arsenicicoccus cauae TaxID=2663847 RepID=A0A6I3IQ02_9MICO|nr:hypothetical protein [Arsenicicoccus cauae]MTB72020.1 hypothetical protein [Arsenicicoccus cauae]
MRGDPLEGGVGDEDVTATVGSVFFEVVERRGGYDGYGAPNAPVRLATQHARLRGAHPGGRRRDR